MKRFSVLLLFIALVSAACGSDSVSRDQALVDAMTDDIISQEVTPDRDEATCVAEKTYDAIGKERLDELGITAGNADVTSFDLADDEAQGTVEALFSCTDVKQSFANSMVGGPIDAAGADCIAEELGDDGLKELFIAGIGTDEPTEDFFDTMIAAGTACDVDIFG